MDSPIRVVLADDHPIIRSGLRLSLATNREIEIVGEAGDGESALLKIRELAPDVAILDIDMPKLDGLTVVRQLRSLNLHTKIILLTLHSEPIYLRAAFDAGAQGYILKDSGTEDVLAAIRAVTSEQMYVAPSMTHHLIRLQTAEKAGGTMGKLSPTERIVMRLIAEGNSSKDIGKHLGIHYRTVDNHRTNICRKLGLEGANSLLRFALQHKGES
ncbi:MULTISPECIES: response regulator transcription factor [Acidobacteriaceae]|uniref:response regulator transcription factor n=1 Tax=Acidobacteriaceae TaxID=204434 RepID=UPI00131DBD36|nr:MULTISPECIES: response regulator transcription factor [Acidobacteriaceae]MDW5266820.1 response regulator transcription factor [Edaphobacter sp.]